MLRLFFPRCTQRFPFPGSRPLFHIMSGTSFFATVSCHIARDRPAIGIPPPGQRELVMQPGNVFCIVVRQLASPHPPKGRTVNELGAERSAAVIFGAKTGVRLGFLEACTCCNDTGSWKHTINGLTVKSGRQPALWLIGRASPRTFRQVTLPVDMLYLLILPTHRRDDSSNVQWLAL